MVKSHDSKGTLVISLDFELYWGMRDEVRASVIENYLQGTYQAIPAILELFAKYEIAATWAVVGFLYYENSSKLQANLPTSLPRYKDSALSPYEYLKHEGDTLKQELHFCPQLIESISRYPRQELGTHTFSHYYCLEPGQTERQFEADLQAAIAIAKTRNHETKSLVFSRNQYNAQYLETISKVGITSYRGNPTSSLYNSIDGDGNKLSKKVLRLLDTYLDLTGDRCYSIKDIAARYPFNIPSSSFLRPYSPKLAYLDAFKLKRITSSLDYAAEQGLLYHLWWHPHNFGSNLNKNLEFLEKILQHYQKLARQEKMRSLNMGEVADICLKLRS